MAGRRNLLVVAPMRSELRPVVRAMSGRAGRLAGEQVFHGSAGPNRVTAAMIGVGPAAAARATKRLLEAERFDHVVVSGIAGGLGPGVPIGRLVTPAVVEDLTSGRRYEPATIGDHTAEGLLATTDELIVDDHRLGGLVERGIVAVDMETAAVAEVSEAAGVAWSVFRVVSDRPQDGLLDHGVFEMLESDGTVNLGRAARYVAANPSRVRALARLARDAGGATRGAARAALAACASL
ncbi:MAG: 5'-methylthioadenosine/S-adenosylhomocysteine nucleosidase family protein [Acidimicrobiales bacterium]